MASNLDYAQIGKAKFPIYKVEENAFLESLKIANSNEVAAERIYEAIKNDEDIPENLKLLYKEAVYGSNERVKNRIRARISSFRRNNRYVIIFGF